MPIDLYIKNPVKYPRPEEVAEMCGGRIGYQGTRRLGGGFGDEVEPVQDVRAGRVYPFVKGVTLPNGATGVVTPITGRRIWNIFLMTGLQEEEVYGVDLSLAELNAISMLKDRKSLLFPLRRIRVGLNSWLYLGDDDRLGERIKQKRKRQRRGYRMR